MGMPRHEAFTCWLGLDAMSLAWPTVVQLVVSFNSSLQWGISQEYSFFVSWVIDLILRSLRCIDWVRKPLCEPNFLCIFVLRIISGSKVKFVQWKAFNHPHPPPGSVYYWPFQGGGPDVVLILCSSVVYTTRRFMFGLALLFVYVFLLSF